MKAAWTARLAGGAAGLANGLFGGGGGMVFLPIQSRWGGLSQRKLYATCVGVIFPVCLVSAAVYLWKGGVSLGEALPYLAGGPWAAVSHWTAGIPFDLAHCGGNFLLALFLAKPLLRLLQRLTGRALPR